MKILRFAAGVLVTLLLSEPGAWAQDLTSTSIYALSFQNQRNIVRAASGTLVTVYQKGSPATSGGGLVMAISRDNGLTWPEVTTLVALPSVFPDVAKGANDDRYIVYSKNGDAVSASADVGFLKLHYQPASDNWSIERQSVVYDADSQTAGYNGVVAWDGVRVWVAYRFRDGAGFRIVVKTSSDDGMTWQDSTTADVPGPNADETAAFVQIGDRLALIYYHQDVEFKWRWRVVSDPLDQWQPSELIYRVTQALPSKSSYSAVADDQGRIHLVFSSRGIQYLQFDGLQWTSSPVPLDAAGGYPSIATDGSRVWAVWKQVVGTSQSTIVWTQYDPLTATWNAQLNLLSDPSEAPPARAWCYSAAFGSFEDVTLAAGNSVSRDVKHSATTVMLSINDDAVYVGQRMPFDYLRVQLKVSGIGGEVQWEYWSGGAWVPFTPQSGAYDFTKSNSIRLWQGVEQAPIDWQQTSIGGDELLYYVRARVTTAFGTQPVGTQITSIKLNDTPTTPARDHSFSVVAWLQRIVAPYAILVRQPTP